MLKKCGKKKGKLIVSGAPFILFFYNHHPSSTNKIITAENPNKKYNINVQRFYWTSSYGPRLSEGQSVCPRVHPPQPPTPTPHSVGDPLIKDTACQTSGRVSQ